MAHYCPVCGVIKILRREVRTCGSPGCLEVWRSWSASQRASAMEKREVEEDVEVGVAELEDWLGRGKTSDEKAGSPIDSILPAAPKKVG